MRIESTLPLLKYAARMLVSSAWLDTDKLNKRQKLYCKCRELVSGDRAEDALFGRGRKNV